MNRFRNTLTRALAMFGLFGLMTAAPAAAGVLFDINGKPKIGAQSGRAIAAMPVDKAWECRHGIGHNYGYVPFGCESSHIHVNGDLADLFFGEPSPETDAAAAEE